MTCISQTRITLSWTYGKPPKIIFWFPLSSVYDVILNCKFTVTPPLFVDVPNKRTNLTKSFIFFLYYQYICNNGLLTEQIVKSLPYHLLSRQTLFSFSRRMVEAGRLRTKEPLTNVHGVASRNTFILIFAVELNSSLIFSVEWYDNCEL
jgi:hypothetical protein